MSEDTNRITLLRELVTQSGGPIAFARQFSQADADKPIDETYVSQILNGHRSFGERAARNMEKRAGLPKRYFEGTENGSSQDENIRAIVTLMESLTSDQRLYLRGKIEGWAEGLPRQSIESGAFYGKPTLAEVNRTKALADKLAIKE